MTYFNLSALTAPLTSIEGLTHAVLQSLLNQSESTQNDRARMGNEARGGSWSDEFIHRVGSRDWTLVREKLTQQTLIRTQRFYEDALMWLVDEEHVSAVRVDVTRLSSTTIGRKVIITTKNGSTVKVSL
ncbi:phage GP46 family protein [Aliivibrio logei]|uniref:phage GP46 family protein n=1 Tax=Aliivibrio logei TaxID=688 RepID=UPI0003A1C424|nr:phage GP46 family protein [Aliivibrio logei]